MSQTFQLGTFSAGPFYGAHTAEQGMVRAKHALSLNMHKCMGGG
jgi:hypothetical protein